MQKIKSILTHVAPTLASALGGPFAGVAVKFIGDALGVEGDASSPGFASALEKLLQDKNNLQKIKAMDYEFKKEMQALNVDVFKLEVDDRKSARTLAQTNMRPHILLSVAFIAMYFFMLGWIFLSEVDDGFNPGMARIENPVLVEGKPYEVDGKVVMESQWVRQEESLVDLFKILLGVLTAGVGQILNFWFGGRMNGAQTEKSEPAG